MSKARETSNQSARLASLDLLRAAAVILVLGRHMGTAPSEQGIFLYGLSGVWGRGGWVGVDLFFVLSGFLIASLLFREYQQFAEIRICRFFVRRGLKIYPPFFTLFAATVLLYAFRGHYFSRPALLGEAFFLQNYLGSIWNHTWSLAVEEHFYVLLPVALMILAKSSRHRTDPFGSLPYAFLVLAVALLGVRVTNALWREHYTHQTHLFPTHLRIDSLMCGVALSYFFHFKADQFYRCIAGRRKLLATAGILLLSPAFIYRLESSFFIYTIGVTVFFVGSGLLLSSFVVGDIPRGSVIRVLAFLGANSYSIYLWHMPVRYWGVRFLEKASGLTFAWPVATLVYLLASILVGVAMGKLVELPVLRLRDRLFPSRSGTWPPRTRARGSGEGDRPESPVLAHPWGTGARNKRRSRSNTIKLHER